MKTKDLHAMTLTDLEKQLRTSRQELFNLRFQLATGQLENHRQIRHVRRDLAQILTEIYEKRSAVAEAQPAVTGKGAVAPPPQAAAAVEAAADDKAEPRRGRRGAAVESPAASSDESAPAGRSRRKPAAGSPASPPKKETGRSSRGKASG